MYKSFTWICVLLFISSCNKQTNVIQLKPSKISSFVYQDKPFELKWKIKKNSITNIPSDVINNIKNVCEKHNRFVLIKIKTFENDTALGTFDCRI